ncbi:MCE family protein [Alphaproteobacteria bacterium KMM 3653]|uniref:MCE family protein n=1 Tax=Harenicola maris TaxID=2841044 RepID=A0AAP2CTI4_9RHOB|nr:MCE family protein [Harenicola maris]
MTQVPNVPLKPARRSFLERASFIWLLPIGALLIVAIVAWQSYNERGRLIYVTFENGSGLVANSTELRYRDVSVGLVEKVTLSEGLEAVEVAIRLSKEIGPYVDGTSQFWVVRPELTTQGVTGLDTVLSGVYIEGIWDAEADPIQDHFEGRPEVPLFRADKPGLQITLRSSPTGQLVDDGPITFRGIEVGRIGKAYIDPTTGLALAEAIIYEPHDQLINDSTRFWDASGFSFTVGAAGASIDFTSLASLLAGGITFKTFVSGSDRTTDGALFQVYNDETSARNSIFNKSQVEELTVSVIFDDNISGLAIDAPVELSGLRIGRVTAVTGVIDTDAFGDNRVRLNALLSIQPSRLGMEGEVSAEAALEFLTNRATQGLRAQLTTASLLTGGLKVQFVSVDDARPAVVRQNDEGIAILPVTQSDISDAEATVEGLISRVNRLPVETLMASAIDFLDAARNLVSDEDLRETPEELRRLLADINKVVASDDVQSVAGNLNGVLGQIQVLLAELEREQAVARLLAAVDSAQEAIDKVDASIEGVPALVAEVTAVATTARGLPLDDLVTRVTSLVQTADELAKTEGVQELPVQLNAALAEVNATLAELREGGAIGNVNATLSSARDAADAVAVSTKDLPAVIDRLNRVLEQASRTIQGYDSGETISRDAKAALRDIQKAAAAVSSLARTLERNPSSLIRGRN